jgi:ribosomal protein S18 acetylase RimI-like enzyme
MSVDIRDIDWGQDGASFRLLDTSFETNRIFTLSSDGLSFKLDEVTCIPPYTKRYAISALDEVTSASSLKIVAYEGGAIKAVAVVQNQTWNGRAVISDFYVTREARGRGIGKALMNAVIARLTGGKARVLWVETQNVNLPAIRFYFSVGFEVCGFDTTLYPNPFADEVAVFLSRNIGIEMPNQSSEPTLASGTSPAGQEPRLP